MDRERLVDTPSSVAACSSQPQTLSTCDCVSSMPSHTWAASTSLQWVVKHTTAVLALRCFAVSSFEKKILA